MSIIVDPRCLQKDQTIEFTGSNIPDDLSGVFKIIAAWGPQNWEKMSQEVDCDRLYTLVSEDGKKYIYKAYSRAADTIQLNNYSKNPTHSLESYGVRIVSRSDSFSGNSR